MVTIEATYDGELRCTASHPSGANLATDAPKDNQGKGESFSPTDLVATALTTCAMTTMAIVARREGFEVGNMTAQVVKNMAADPRRIAGAPMQITIHGSYTADQKAILENAARNCPVAKSLHPSLDGSIVFLYVAPHPHP